MLSVFVNFLLFPSLFTCAGLGVSGGEQEMCHLVEKSTNSCEKEASKTRIRLEEIEESWVGKDKLFLIETSGRDYLPGRYLCAAESACANSDIPVLIVLTSPFFDAALRNGTAQMLRKCAGRVHLRYAGDNRAVLERSHFGSVAETVLKAVNDSATPAQHLGDALRLALVYRFGGWYADFDTMFLKPLTDFTTDVVSTDNFFPQGISIKRNEQGHEKLGTKVSNGVFRFAKPESPFLRLVIERFATNFRPNLWTSGGADIFIDVLRTTCEITPKELMESDGMITVERYSADRCSGVQVVHPKHFFPRCWMQAMDFYIPPRTDEEWMNEVFSEAYSVDFYQSSGTSQPVMMPKHYGVKKPAYVSLGPIHCPDAFFGERLF